MHRLLQRQIRKYLGDKSPTRAELDAFLRAVGDAYEAFDADRKLLDRSVEISSAELLEANERLHQEALVQERALASLKESLRSLRESGNESDLESEDVLSISDLLQDQIERRNRAEAALREREQRIQLILQSTPECAIFVQDPVGKITSWNEGACHITGYTKDEVLGRPDSMFDPSQESDTFAETERREAALTGNASTEGWRLRKDGTRYWSEATLSALRDESGELTGFVKIARDMTKRRHQEETLQKTTAAAEAANLAKSMFLANMSHEIRTPMNGVIGMTGLLEETDLTADQREMLETIQSSSASLLALISDILDLSKVEAGMLSLNKTQFDLHDLVSSTLDVFKPMLKGGQVELRLEYDGDTPRAIETDEARLRQVLFNLIGNSVKFTNTGHISVLIRSEPVEDQISFRVTVRDTGIGIPEEFLDSLFEPFSQVESNYTRATGGTGLGLAISTRLVDALGGEIWVESKVGEGSSFHFTFVVPKVERSRLKLQPAPQRKPVRQLPRFKILIVEDNPINQKVASTLLRRLGQEPELVVDGAEAVKAVGNKHYDIIFMDVQMPIMNGLDATMAIRALRITQPYIIALTANAMPEDRARCRDAGMNEFMSKPVELEDFRRVLGDYQQAGTRKTGRFPDSV